MPIADIDAIEVRSRQRSRHEPQHLKELRDSIEARGNLSPPVCWFDPAVARWVLCAGAGRLEAIKMLAAEGKTYSVDNREVPPGKLVFLSLLDTLDEASRFEAEFDENIRRRDLSWQDRIAALARLHELRCAVNPDHTMRATAQELVAAGASTNVSRAATGVHEALTIAKHLDNPKVSGARNAGEAYSEILRTEEERINAAIARRTLASLPDKPEVEVRHGDATTILPSLDAARFDLILADPPYGIGADAGGFRARTIVHHNYVDTAEAARNILATILNEGFRVTKTRANLFLFTDIQHWSMLQEASARMGWTPFRTPILWQKSTGEGLAPWGSAGFRRTYDIIFYATKGNKGLISSPVDILYVPRVPRRERIHAAEKPVELMRKLIECSTLPGEAVLDPCCGSGSTLVACRELRRRALGIELDQDFVTTAMSNVYAPEKESTNA